LTKFLLLVLDIFENFQKALEHNLAFLLFRSISKEFKEEP
jgi:hypothetical protein